MASYLLKFKANPKIDDVYVEVSSFEAALSEITENVNELEWALEISGIPPSINAKDVTRDLIDAYNWREENPDWKEREEETARRENADRRSAYYSQVM